MGSCISSSSWWKQSGSKLAPWMPPLALCLPWKNGTGLAACLHKTRVGGEEARVLLPSWKQLSAGAGTRDAGPGTLRGYGASTWAPLRRVGTLLGIFWQMVALGRPFSPTYTRGVVPVAVPRHVESGRVPWQTPSPLSVLGEAGLSAVK